MRRDKGMYSNGFNRGQHRFDSAACTQAGPPEPLSTTAYILILFLFAEFIHLCCIRLPYDGEIQLYIMCREYAENELQRQ